jgi:uncharacterized protein
MIFVDSGAWFAGAVRTDINHQAARDWLDSNDQALVTTDYIIDETLTLLRGRGYTASAIEVGEGFFAGKLAQIILVEETDLREAWSIFRQFLDKDWSFTDCTSKAVMDRLEIQRAFSFDHHFRQFGSVIVEP